MRQRILNFLVRYILVGGGTLQLAGAGQPSLGIRLDVPSRPRGENAWERLVTRMAGLSQKAAAGCLNFITGKEESMAKPAEAYLALCTVVPTNSSTGASITEGTAAEGYARLKVNGNLASAVEAAKSSIKTNAELVGAAITGGEATIIGWALCDKKETGKGNVIAYGTCSSTIISKTQTPPTVASGKLIIELE